MKMKYKIVNDSIHGPIRLGPVHLAFIDTTPFQRLRNILQLGAGSWVYPTACHHRFEHSLGTCFLAGKLLRQMRQLRSQNLSDELVDVEITDEMILCSEIAGLLHDIGHGPFSHCWDAEVMPALGKRYEHEKVSIDIIDWLLKDEDMRAKLLAENFGESQIRIVKEMIYGQLPGEEDQFYKKTDPKSFIYDIISNKLCGLDVDKLDYLARDGAALGTVQLQPGDLERLLLTTAVINYDGAYHLCWRDVSSYSITHVFQLRHQLHTIAYKHKTVVSISLMLTDAIRLADGHYKFSKLYPENGTNETMDVTNFLKLTDHIFWEILFSRKDEPGLEESRELMERISTRRLYAPLASSFLYPNDIEKIEDVDIEGDLRKLIDEFEDIDDVLKKKCRDSLIIKKCKFDYGMGEQFPLDLLPLQSKTGNVIERGENTYATLVFYPKYNKAIELRLYSRLSHSREPNGKTKENDCHTILMDVFYSWTQKLDITAPLRY